VPVTTAEIAALHADLSIPADYGTRYGLVLQPEANQAELLLVGCNRSGRPITLVNSAAESWLRMKAAAAQGGIELIAVSGFRSIARQAEIIRAKLSAGQSIHDILRTNAAPGFSEHHTGRALDVGAPGYLDLETSFGQTPAFRWLTENAARFGFHLSYPRDNANGIRYEPWHWRWSV
jgi:D-alanyl-D-alanine carboxypeptidase